MLEAWSQEAIITLQLIENCWLELKESVAGWGVNILFHTHYRFVPGLLGSQADLGVVKSTGTLWVFKHLSERSWCFCTKKRLPQKVPALPVPKLPKEQTNGVYLWSALQRPAEGGKKNGAQLQEQLTSGPS